MPASGVVELCCPYCVSWPSSSCILLFFSFNRQFENASLCMRFSLRDAKNASLLHHWTGLCPARSTCNDFLRIGERCCASFWTKRLQTREELLSDGFAFRACACSKLWHTQGRPYLRFIKSSLVAQEIRTQQLGYVRGWPPEANVIVTYSCVIGRS